ncbi:MAG: DNA mismatch endonuclease Vsr [Proteobacteria bacterium]|nr:DNA mismatch endonuclease Vsr [Pseudomonadota bacterium]MBU4288040.1 DNA mismatch endonuclease Vsr [Pseudomonadota bacterium]
MGDIYSKSKRSSIMSKISGKETKPEVLVRKYLFSKGFRYRKNVTTLPGNPDIVLPKYKAAIFVHGCFWHGHSGCSKSKPPTTRTEFWQKKIGRTIERDKEKIDELSTLGWRVAVVWECGLKNNVLIESAITELEKWLKSIEERLEIP